MKQKIQELPSLETAKKKGASALKNPDKIYWPEDRLTKGDLAAYYHEIGPVMLPYLKNRPVMLHRYPEGIGHSNFYQKDSSTLHLPEGVQTVTLQHEEKPVQYILIQDLKTLAYVVSLGTIEIHPFLTQSKDIEHPDFFVVDLDPEGISFDQVIKVAQEVHQILDAIKVKNFCKTSGKDGLHIYVPVKGKYTFEQMKQFGEIIASCVHQKLPEITSLERKPINRQGKVYIDIYQNNKGQTVASPYSVRGVAHAPVSTPLDWDEVKKGLSPLDFTIKTLLPRINLKGDLFKPLLKASGLDMPAALNRLEKIIH